MGRGGRNVTQRSRIVSGVPHVAIFYSTGVEHCSPVRYCLRFRLDFPKDNWLVLGLGFYFVITAAIRLFTAIFEPLLPTGWRVTSIISNLLIILGGVIILRNQAFSTATLTTMVVIVAGFGWIVEGVMSILESELSSNRALAILSGALSIIAGMFVFIYPLWSAKMLVIFSGAALLVFGVTLIVRAIQFGKLVH